MHHLPRLHPPKELTWRLYRSRAVRAEKAKARETKVEKEVERVAKIQLLVRNVSTG